ncbi:hypothetical protein GCWU000324_02062 [Kingella oralis ATCC 51147]|uniref:Uncharacterized protein n=1 Tax=Kingella oralis ATCC 51147 TaxID=629741 RepID=C4GJ39_9NEIS|nr:hypothetical protein GCWU000324_02062 [Kingella oralis ATCC 51147]
MVYWWIRRFVWRFGVAMWRLGEIARGCMAGGRAFAGCAYRWR